MAIEVNPNAVQDAPRTACAFKRPVPTKIAGLCLIAVFAFGLNGCSSMSAQARRERAYRHYVEKQTREKQKQMARAQKAANRDMKRRMKGLQPSEPQMTSSVEEVPAPNYSSVFDPVNQPEPAASSAETTVAPVTVSASHPVVAQEPEQQPSHP